MPALSEGICKAQAFQEVAKVSRQQAACQPMIHTQNSENKTVRRTVLFCTSAAEGFAFRFVTIIWMNTVITANANCFCITACILVINTIVYAA